MNDKLEYFLNVKHYFKNKEKKKGMQSTSFASAVAPGVLLSTTFKEKCSV